MACGTNGLLNTLKNQETLSSGTRQMREHRFSEGFQASPVCPSDKE
jgi:hypothetical protein